MKEVVARKEEIVNRRERDEAEMRASVRDMEDCDKILQGWHSRRIHALNERWGIKVER